MEFFLVIIGGGLLIIILFNFWIAHVHGRYLAVAIKQDLFLYWKNLYLEGISQYEIEEELIFLLHEEWTVRPRHRIRENVAYINALRRIADDSDQLIAKNKLLEYISELEKKI